MNMPEVKSLNVTADTYRHRGWMWRDRATYEIFKAHMKLPLWIDRILTSSGGDNLYVVGKEDGDANTSYVGSFRRGVEKRLIVDAQPTRAVYNCNSREGNGFRVIAERIRAKKPDTNKPPRPQWRQPMTKPWEPGTLGGNWVVDSKFVKEVKLKMPPPPAWADRLWVSTAGGSDTFVWVNSKSNGQALGKERHQAEAAQGVVGHKVLGQEFRFNEVLSHESCRWQLAGVRKKTVGVPEPEVRKPATNVPLVTQTEQLFYGTDSGRIPHLNPLLAAPYGSLDSKPPIGVKPRSVHDGERANALDEAMVRYLNEDLPFPIEWATEWNELRARLNKEQK